MAEEIQPIPPEEVGIAFDGPAALANRFFIMIGPAGVRLAFAEQPTPTMPPVFRAAVVLPFEDAIQLSKLLGTMLA